MDESRDVESAAAALAFGMSPEDTARRLAEQRGIPEERALLVVREAEVRLRRQ